MKLQIKNKIQNTCGTVMAEALVAVAVLAMSAVILSGIFNNSVSSITTSENYTVAQNLAIEGVEIVKSIRATNFLIAPNNPECWLVADPGSLVGVGGCDNDKVSDGNYIPVEANGRWKLEEITDNGLNLDGDNGSNNSFRLYKNDTTNRMIHNNNSNLPTIYYRSINFPEVTPSYATVSVKIQWKEGARVRTFEESFKIR
jgi:hypothetical protein